MSVPTVTDNESVGAVSLVTDNESGARVDHVTDDEGGGGAGDNRNTADAAASRLGFSPISESQCEEWRRAHRSSIGVSCTDCGHEYNYIETIIYSSTRRQNCFGHWCSQKTSYCSTCHPPDRLWNHECGSCDSCGRETYVPYRSGRQHIFCSDKCSQKYYNERQKEIRLATRQKHCKSCRKEFIASRSDAKFCSPACKQRNYRLERAS